MRVCGEPGPLTDLPFEKRLLGAPFQIHQCVGTDCDTDAERDQSRDVDRFESRSGRVRKYSHPVFRSTCFKMKHRCGVLQCAVHSAHQQELDENVLSMEFVKNVISCLILVRTLSTSAFPPVEPKSSHVAWQLYAPSNFSHQQVQTAVPVRYIGTSIARASISMCVFTVCTIVNPQRNKDPRHRKPCRAADGIFFAHIDSKQHPVAVLVLSISHFSSCENQRKPKYCFGVLLASLLCCCFVIRVQEQSKHCRSVLNLHIRYHQIRTNVVRFSAKSLQNGTFFALSCLPQPDKPVFTRHRRAVFVTRYLGPGNQRQFR